MQVLNGLQKVINIVSYAMTMDVNWCHVHVCSLFQVLKCIAAGMCQVVCVYELPSMFHQNNM